MVTVHDQFASIRDYAAIGDGRTVALIRSDGRLDWLCLPDLDSESVFAALLDPDNGGSFELAPTAEFSATRRYLPQTNVLETTFTTNDGTVRVLDAMTLPLAGLAPQRELVRRVEGLAGSVAMQWRVALRFRYGERRPRITRRGGVPIATASADAVAVSSWEAGAAEVDDAAIAGRFTARPGSRALIALAAGRGEPLVLPSRREAEERLEETISFWRRWSQARSYEGPWREAVIRSILALKLLVYAPSGAIAAAATASLPEAIGGERNWDYRFSWVRDAAFTLDAFLALDSPNEARAYFWWLLHASQLTHPRVRVLYGLDGGARTPESELPLPGYRNSRPVRVGNAAGTQRQLDVYGELLQTAHRYALKEQSLDRDTGRRMAEVADEVCKLWREPDAGIWEVRSESRHFTQSKVMCWVALDCAAALAQEGQIPGRNAALWRREAEEIADFIEERCWSPQRGSYVRYAGADELDVSLLFTALMGYRPPDARRVDRTLDALRDGLGVGSLLYRYHGDDGLQGSEGAFTACSFWLVEALVRRGRLEEAEQLMDELLTLANDVGLYAEEIDPGSGEFLGNFPQGLVHLALVNAAVAFREAAQQ
jgi:GH15 family glucan-1,4-alpha-glucosidase